MTDQAQLIDCLLDIAQDFKTRHDNTPRWRIYRRHTLLAAWLQAVSHIQLIEQRNAQRRPQTRT